MEMKHKAHAQNDYLDKLAMAGHCWLVRGIFTDGVIDSLQKLLSNRRVYDRVTRSHTPYGDGRICEQILAVLDRARLMAET